jgi:hypothetical protein
MLGVLRASIRARGVSACICMHVFMRADGVPTPLQVYSMDAVPLETASLDKGAAAAGVSTSAADLAGGSLLAIRRGVPRHSSFDLVSRSAQQPFAFFFFSYVVSQQATLQHSAMVTISHGGGGAGSGAAGSASSSSALNADGSHRLFLWDFAERYATLSRSIYGHMSLIASVLCAPRNCHANAPMHIRASHTHAQVQVPRLAALFGGLL